MISRRSFVFDGSAALAALVSFPMGFSVPSAKPRPFTEAPGFAGFAALVDTTFHVRLASGEVVGLKLMKARLEPRRLMAQGRQRLVDAHYEKFSLIFTGPAHLPLSS